MSAPILKLMRSLREFGWRGTLKKLYVYGDLKFGTIVGTDKFGNMYFENKDLPYGQHRWIEYADIHNFDASQIPPEWHGWMTHTFDEPPTAYKIPENLVQIANPSHAIYASHLGGVISEPERQNNKTDFRARGWKVGSLTKKAEEPEQYYKQPGHPLHPLAEEGGRFKNRKDQEDEWDPSKPVAAQVRKPLRPLTEV